MYTESPLRYLKTDKKTYEPKLLEAASLAQTINMDLEDLTYL